VLDIDYFKAVNDTYGHDAGDEVLREFSDRLKKSIRGIDLACRYGGEEFVVVMPDTDMSVAGMVPSVCAGALRRSRSESPRIPRDRSNDLHRHGRPGSAEDDAAGMLKRADLALYRAKRDGRNRVVADAA